MLVVLLRLDGPVSSLTSSVKWHLALEVASVLVIVVCGGVTLMHFPIRKSGLRSYIEARALRPAAQQIIANRDCLQRLV